MTTRCGAKPGFPLSVHPRTKGASNELFYLGCTVSHGNSHSSIIVSAAKMWPSTSTDHSHGRADTKEKKKMKLLPVHPFERSAGRPATLEGPCPFPVPRWVEGFGCHRKIPHLCCLLRA